ncbi:MAG: hypothetical protein H5T71_00985 [Chloroflexi bacterium]|nr:hypothetical protein [Chloroflexota bacterium]
MCENAWQLAVYLGNDDQGKKLHLYETVRGTKRDAQRRLSALLGEHDSRRTEVAKHLQTRLTAMPGRRSAYFSREGRPAHARSRP